MKGHKTGGRQKGTPNKWTDKLREKAVRYGLDALDVCHQVLMDPEEDTKNKLKAAEVILKPAAIQVQDITPAGVTVNLGFITAGERMPAQVMTLDAPVVALPGAETKGT